MILFLDFDGVLTSSRASAGIGESLWTYLDPVACRFIEHRCIKNNVEVVISSTWRIGQESGSYFRGLFGAAGFSKIKIHTDFRTKQLKGNRGNEIQEWLDRHGNPEYIILDDDSDMLERQKPRFIKTDTYNGLLHEHMLEFDRLLLLKTNDTANSGS